MLIIKNELMIIVISYIDIYLYKTIFKLFKIIIQSDECTSKIYLDNRHPQKTAVVA